MSIEDIALSMLNLKPDVCSHLIEVFGSVESIFTASKEDLASKAELNNRIILKLCDKTLLERAKEELMFCERYGIRILNRMEEEYSDNLRDCFDAPHNIYVKGGVDFNHNHSRWIAVVGTRKNSTTGYSYCKKIIEDIAEKYPDTVIVSGLAYGIDAIAHQTAIDCGLKTVAFVAHGLDTIYPSLHRDLAKRIIEHGGAIATEYPRNTAALPANFLQRNRLVAGVSVATIVVESPLRGGAMATANITDSYSRELFAMPGRSTDASFSGCNNLIKSSKANMLENIADFNYIMGWNSQCTQTSAVVNEKLSLTDDELAVYNCFYGSDEISQDEIIEQTGFHASKCMTLLTTMELNDIIKQVKGKLYIKMR